MSLFGQLSSQYWNADSVWVLRDIDMLLWLWYDHPKLARLFQETRDRVIAILAAIPTNGSHLRNDIFAAKDIVVKDEKLNSANLAKIVWTDKINTEYQRLMRLRQMMERAPIATLQAIIDRVWISLKTYPLDIVNITHVSQSVDSVDDDSFHITVTAIASTLDHTWVIAFFEWCILQWKCLPLLIDYAEKHREEYAAQKQSSMQYWNYTNIINLASTRNKIIKNWEDKNWKSFSLSGGSGNTFSQLAIMQRYVEDGGKIISISGTSAWSAMAILVASIGNDAGKIKELMNDFVAGNMDWSIPNHLLGHEKKMREFYDRIIEKYGLTYSTIFSDLKIPVVVNAGRQYKWGEQEVVLGWDENIMHAVWASQNVPKPWKNDNTWALGVTPVHGVNMIDYAANERGNPTHWLELLWVEQNDIVAIESVQKIPNAS